MNLLGELSLIGRKNLNELFIKYVVIKVEYNKGAK